MITLVQKALYRTALRCTSQVLTCVRPVGTEAGADHGCFYIPRCTTGTSLNKVVIFLCTRTYLVQTFYISTVRLPNNLCDCFLLGKFKNKVLFSEISRFGRSARWSLKIRMFHLHFGNFFPGTNEYVEAKTTRKVQPECFDFQSSIYPPIMWKRP